MSATLINQLNCGFPGVFINLNADDGIMAEIAGKQQLVPRCSQAERDAAEALVHDDNWLSGEDKKTIVGHISGTPYYDWD